MFQLKAKIFENTPEDETDEVDAEVEKNRKESFQKAKELFRTASSVDSDNSETANCSFENDDCIEDEDNEEGDSDDAAQRKAEFEAKQKLFQQN